MRINPIFNTQICTKAPTFKSLKQEDTNYTKNWTYFFRDFTPQLNNAILQRYSKPAQTGEKINVYSLGASDGTEAYSIALWLEENLGKDSKNFFPIIAKELDEEKIALAKSGKIGCYDFDIVRASGFAPNAFKKHIKVDKEKVAHTTWGDYYMGQVDNSLKDSVIFKQANLLEDNIEEKKDNTIIFCRNTMSYFPANKVHSYAKELYDKMGKNSMLIIGKYDLLSYNPNDKNDFNEMFGIVSGLEKAGFKRLKEAEGTDDEHCIWIKE